jgi:hypothetical protein
MTEQETNDWIDRASILPPGTHPLDPSKPGIDPVAFVLGKVQTHLAWIEEHLATFEKLRNSEPQSANKELQSLASCAGEAWHHLQRLKELLLAGYSVDQSKQPPKGIHYPLYKTRYRSPGA